MTGTRHQRADTPPQFAETKNPHTYLNAHANQDIPKLIFWVPTGWSAVPYNHSDRRNGLERGSAQSGRVDSTAHTERSRSEHAKTDQKRAISDILFAAMNPHQRKKLEQLEDELGVARGTLPIRGESEGYVFTEVHGVTVLLTRQSRNPRGGYIVPALHTYLETVYPTNLDAAVHAKELFDHQGPAQCKYGHLGPIVDLDWKCGDDYFCVCRWRETYAQRVARSLGS